MVPKLKGEGKVAEQKSFNKIMLKAILKTHQTMRDLSSTVWDTLLIKATSPEAHNMQKQTQTFAEKVRQEEKGHTRGPPFVWCGHTWALSIKSLQQRSNAVGARTAQGIATYCPTGTALANADLRRGAFLQAGQNVQSRHQDSHAPEKRLLVLEALSQTESERKYGRAAPTAMERELQAFLEDLLNT